MARKLKTMDGNTAAAHAAAPRLIFVSFLRFLSPLTLQPLSFTMSLFCAIIDTLFTYLIIYLNYMNSIAENIPVYRQQGGYL